MYVSVCTVYTCEYNIYVLVQYYSAKQPSKILQPFMTIYSYWYRVRSIVIVQVK